ncbi:PP2C family protein-serine/threonine phosphatase [Rivularia sp. UHCC 0363]|uniref:PP2C family protein-serine/threonine phosphatase n=1 Tax=Rivularia sp. UHCC 0363 TaxID=3110244 RepID=UPI002B2154E1|nr:SpoIIE family protein phosphatase [Rivularia sp. UHCC 0363]MEA5597350.1 SpoIIE family protein phosphatase [Rivularia sp. UHCC 0363]
MTGVIANPAAELRRSNNLMRELLVFGASLPAGEDLSHLVEKILLTAKSLCCADAGVLYLHPSLYEPSTEPASSLDCLLDCVGVQIDSLQLNLNRLQSPSCLSTALQLTNQSWVAKAALARAVTAVDLTASSQGSDDQQFDQDYGYRSMFGLAVPFQDSNGEMLGVLQLLNSRHPETQEILPFDAVLCEIMQWFAAQVSSALEDQRLRKNQASWVKAEQEIQVGRKIQLDFLPEALPQVKSWEIAARFYPAREVAGDFYDAFPMGHGRIGIVIADVCDKGVGAALFMSLFRSFLRVLAQQNYALNLLDSLINNSPKAKQDKQSRLPSIGTQALKNAMERTNNYIVETHCRTNMFATIFFGVLDPATGKLIYINGGHESPFICNANGIKQRLHRTGPAVGVFSNAKFEIELTQLEPGDILLGYTDGVPDARSPNHERYGEPRLCQLVESASMDSAAGLLDRIDDAVHRHIAGIDPFDDITLIALRRDS